MTFEKEMNVEKLILLVNDHEAIYGAFALWEAKAFGWKLHRRWSVFDDDDDDDVDVDNNRNNSNTYYSNNVVLIVIRPYI